MFQIKQKKYIIYCKPSNRCKIVVGMNFSISITKRKQHYVTLSTNIKYLYWSLLIPYYSYWIYSNSFKLCNCNFYVWYDMIWYVWYDLIFRYIIDTGFIKNVFNYHYIPKIKNKRINSNSIITRKIQLIKLLS